MSDTDSGNIFTADSKLAVHLRVGEQQQGQRLDAVLSEAMPDTSRARIQAAISKIGVLLDGQRAKGSTRVRAGQTISFVPLPATADESVAEDISLDILYEDEHIVVINKSPGMVVHPAKGHWSGTLTSALAHRYRQGLSTVGGPSRPGIVHRLDRDTSGVIVVARTDVAHMRLAAQFEARSVEKEYIAIVSPPPVRDRDMIRQPIGPHPYQREKMAIRAGHASSRPAETFYEVRERYQRFAVLAAFPKTGRTHQIRVHLAHLGSPVLCDRLYSGRAKVTSRTFDQSAQEDRVILARQALHAGRLTLRHPESDEPLDFRAQLPDDMLQTIQWIQAASKGSP